MLIHSKPFEYPLFASKDLLKYLKNNNHEYLMFSTQRPNHTNNNIMLCSVIRHIPLSSILFAKYLGMQDSDRVHTQRSQSIVRIANGSNNLIDKYIEFNVHFPTSHKLLRQKVALLKKIADNKKDKSTMITMVPLCFDLANKHHTNRFGLYTCIKLAKQYFSNRSSARSNSNLNSIANRMGLRTKKMEDKMCFLFILVGVIFESKNEIECGKYINTDTILNNEAKAMKIAKEWNVPYITISLKTDDFNNRKCINIEKLYGLCGVMLDQYQNGLYKQKNIPKVDNTGNFIIDESKFVVTNKKTIATQTTAMINIHAKKTTKNYLFWKKFKAKTT